MNAASNEPTNDPSAARHTSKPSFGSVAFGLLVALMGSVGVQTLIESLRGVEATALENGTMAAGAVAVTAAALFTARRQLYKYLASADAAVVVLIAMMVMTVVGTVVFQGADEPTFRARYPSAAPILLALHVDDIFHSLPFALLLVLLAVASAITVVRRRVSFKKWRNFGLFLSHVSVLVILLGGLIGAIGGSRGKVHLEVGQAADAFDTMPRGSRPSERAELGFSVRLDRFDVDRHPPEFEFYTYESVPGADGWKLVAVEEPTVGAAIGRPRGDAPPTVTVSKLFLNGKLTRAGADRHRLTLKSGQRIEVAVGQALDLGGGAKATIQSYFPDLVIDRKTNRPRNRTDAPNNPALALSVIDASGAVSTEFLYGRKALRRRVEGAAAGLTYERIAGPVELTESTDGTSNPAAEITLRWPDGTTQRAVRFATSGEPIELGAGRYLVFRERPQTIKTASSILTVVEDGKEVTSQEVYPNGPLYVGDYALYQTMPDSNTPSVSTIEVVKDPGLGLVKIGLWALLAGVLHTVALRHTRPKWGKDARARDAVDRGTRGPAATPPGSDVEATS